MNLEDFGEIFQDIAAGEKYGTNDHLEIIGWDIKSNRTKRYLVKCSVCSKDPELFGEGYFKAYRSNLLNGSIPCGCSRLVYWTESQQAVRASRKANSLGFKFIDWAAPYVDCNTKVIMLCCDHGLWNSTKLQALMTLGHGCPKCSAAGSSLRERMPEDFLEKQIKDKANSLGYTFLGWSEPYSGSYTKCLLTCPDHGVWGSTPASNMISGFSKVGCPKCAFNKISTAKLMCENLRLAEIKSIAKEKHLIFSGFVEEYTGNTTKLKLICQRHGLWETCTISNFLRGASCPSCNGHNQKQAYINIVYDKESPVALKFGIAQNFKARLWKQNHLSEFNLVNHSVYIFNETEACKMAERDVKNSMLCEVLEKSVLPDGYTETTHLENLNDIIKIFTFHGGTPI